MNNKDKKKEYMKEYCRNNKDKKKEYNKEYRRNNKDKKKEYDKEYHRNNKDYYYELNCKRRRSMSRIKLFNDKIFPMRVHWHHINNILVIPVPMKIHKDCYAGVYQDVHREKVRDSWIYGFLDVENIIKDR